MEHVQSFHVESECHLASFIYPQCCSPKGGLCTNIVHCYFHQGKNHLKVQILVTKQVPVIAQLIEFSGNSTSRSNFHKPKLYFFHESDNYMIFFLIH